MELEGSQRFRQRLALSCISGKSFALKNVRLMDTEKPGLNQYEADILRLIDELSDGMTVIIDKKTLTSMKFTPGLLLGCHEGKSFTCSKERGLSYYIEFLIMLGPFCKKGVDIVLKGVTDHPADLCVDTLKSGGEKILKKCGLEMFIVIEKRGMLPDGGGRVRVSVSPVTKLEPIKLVYAGNVKAIKGTAWATNTSSLFASRMGESCRRVFRPVIHHVEIYSDLVRGDRCGKSQGYGISLTAETMKGFGYTADGFVDRTNFVKGKTKLTAAVKRISELPTEMGESVEEELDGPEILAEQVGAKLLARILDQGICDSCFQWVPLFFMALSEEYGVSKVLMGRLGSSAVSMMRSIDEFLGLKFTLSQPVAQCDTFSVGENTSFSSSESDREDDDSLNIISESEKLRAEFERDILMVSCVGLGIRSMARKTF